MIGDAPSSRERMHQLRMKLLDAMRSRTPAADAKGSRLLVSRVLLITQPDSLLGEKLAGCGKRNPRNDSRRFCEHPACPVCMRRRGVWLFLDRLFPALEGVPSSRLRWVTVLMFRCADLDEGAHEMDRQLRRLRHILKKFAGGAGASPGRMVRVWGAREVERDGSEWLFHVHMLIDFADADPASLAEMLRDGWGRGGRQVQFKPMLPRSNRLNLFRMAQYMTKARYSSAVDGRHIWWTNEDIAAIALWRDRQPAQWHRFTFGVRGR
jgi:hypothetical protein